MGRKRKHTDLASETRSHLPPCRVCDAPGAGFHYGANTCEACKGFFHRSLKMSSQYKCEGNYYCVVEHGHQKLCQYCRYQKCLSVGMAKEAIKTGRYTSTKRTNDILEIKRLHEKTKNKSLSTSTHRSCQSLPDLPVANSDSEADTTLGFESKTDQCPVLVTSTARQFSFTCMADVKPEKSEFLLTSMAEVKPEKPDCHICPQASYVAGQRPCTSISCQILAETDDHRPLMCTNTASLVTADSPSHISSFLHISSLPEIESIFSESPPNCNEFKMKQPPTQSNQLFSELSPLSLSSPYGSPAEGSTMKPSPSVLTDVASPSVLTDVASSLLSLSSAVTYSPGQPAPSSSIAAAVTQSPSSELCMHSPTAPLTSDAATVPPALPARSGLSSSLASLDIEMYMCNSPGSVCQSAGDVSEHSISELYWDKDMVVRILLEGDENFVVPLAGRMTEEEIKRQQQEHFDACSLQREMFGQLRRLPDHEYDYIFATTGLDTDDRQQRLRIMGAGLEKVIRAMVKFCKVIPGFSRLGISDKVKLIKYSRQEFCLFTIYKFIDAEKKIMRGLDNQWKCENEISRMSTTDSDSSVFMENLDLHFRFCDSLQSLKLSDEELVVIRAIIIMAPDRNPHTDSPTVRDIYWQLHECLIHVLSKRYTNALFIYAKIVGKLTEARSQTETMLRFFKRLKIEKYSNVMSNPLLREMCSGIFFDEKDDDVIILCS
ncbi:hypothetical protein BsWGS_27061 [Bradybaena similaris]